MDEKRIFIKIKYDRNVKTDNIRLINLSELVKACNLVDNFDLSRILENYNIEWNANKNTVWLEEKNIAAE